MNRISRRSVLGAACAASVGSAVPGLYGVGRAEAVPDPLTTDIESHRALVAAARAGSPDLGPLIAALCPRLASLPARREPLAKVAGSASGAIGWGNPSNNDAAVVWGEHCVFLTAHPRPVTIRIDEGSARPMKAVTGTPYWYRVERIRLGATHNFSFYDGERELDCYTVAGYTPASYPRLDVPRGTMSEQRTITSALYGGAQSDYWLYVNPGVDGVRGAPLMLWLDGGMHVGNRDWRGLRMQVVTDNLVHDGRIPPMVHVLINPGRGGPPQPKQYPDEDPGSAMRSLQYDTVSDLFARHIAEEVLPQVGREVKLRPDGYSHAVAGQSSGGTACFKLGWYRPDLFSRVMPSIAGFTALGLQPEDGPTGGFLFPYLVRREPRRNLRVWLSESMNGIDVAEDGRRDMYLAGSWPLANIAMAQALKTRGYDFHFRYGQGYHNMAQQGLDLPEALAWLWRGYDPDRTAQAFEQDPAERAAPLYRVGIVNRPAW
ncbi:alpha/beta hydrolase-fold protein [Sphingomonas sp.]|uniref:alpha/beta hydrolase n=1 Tax=Sphingomonas sp. TaxID=28214 RepID=UPI001B18EF87|nr:alpha/beta hydrolase-fold protein [Sphingomonas sp.]MBO9711657.1 hypothetical protein [Sphingomonas sp.]